MTTFPVTIPGYQLGIKRKILWATKIQTTASGREVRHTYRTEPRYEFEVGWEYLREAGVSATYQPQNEPGALQTFLNDLQGSFGTFAFCDPYDVSGTVTLTAFATGTGAVLAYPLPPGVVGTTFYRLDASLGWFTPPLQTTPQLLYPTERLNGHGNPEPSTTAGYTSDNVTSCSITAIGLSGGIVLDGSNATAIWADTAGLEGVTGTCTISAFARRVSGTVAPVYGTDLELVWQSGGTVLGSVTAEDYGGIWRYSLPITHLTGEDPYLGAIQTPAMGGAPVQVTGWQYEAGTLTPYHQGSVIDYTATSGTITLPAVLPTGAELYVDAQGLWRTCRLKDDNMDFTRILDRIWEQRKLSIVSLLGE